MPEQDRERTERGDADDREARRPSARNEVAGGTSGSVVQAGSVQGGIHVYGPAGRAPMPAQLPAARPYFTNRTQQLETLARMSETAPATVVINGVGGVGKTSLALAWLHQIRGRFTDGQLFTDLHGFSSGSFISPTEPLGRFLRAMDVRPEAVPTDVDEQAALFRSLTAGRRMIIMLDNAASAAQVRPLLPGHGPAVVVVTSRRRLSGLAIDGAAFLPLGPLDENGAVELLDRMLGPGRTSAEPQAAQSLVSLCGRLPLALCTSAARLATRGHWPIEQLVNELTDERGRLAALTDEDDLSVQAVFDVTYQDLPATPARLYRLMTVHPDRQFGAHAAAAIAGTTLGEALPALDTLVGANLLEAVPGGRYQLHDLARVHARSVAGRIESESDRARAFRRLLDHYLDTAVEADRVIISGRWHLGRRYARPRTDLFADVDAAIDWMERELGNLTSMVDAAHARGLHQETWEMCEALWGVMVLRKHYAAWIGTHEKGLASAAALGDPRPQARMLEALAAAHLNLRDFPTAAQQSREALALERGAGHDRGAASALECLGVAQLGRRDAAGAIATFSEALETNRAIGSERGVAMMTRRLGEALTREARFDEGIDHLSAALTYFTGQGDDYNRARTLSTLADALIADNRHGEAREALDAALEAATRVGAHHEQAKVHVALGDLAALADDRPGERDHLLRAVVIFEAMGAPQAAEILARATRLGAAPDSDPAEPRPS